jgi:hypothetical protein
MACLFKLLMTLNKIISNMKRAVIVVVLLGLLVNSTFAQKPAVVLSNEPGWHKIGEITASFKMEDESIAVLGADKFAAIKLRVTDAPINIVHVQVFYEDGQMEEVDVKNELTAGSETRVIDLAGSDKELKKVAFTYKTLPNQKDEKAHIELYGYKANRDNDAAYRNDKDNNKVESNAEEAREEAKEESRDINHDAKQAEEKAETKSEKVGDDISEAAGNVGAEIKDKPYVDKVGPNGERIFMDRHSKYYYINSEGKKVFITKLEMKDNPKH